MNYVTTNIRIPEEDYLRLKSEAVHARVSFAEIVRQRIGNRIKTANKKDSTAVLLRKLKAQAKRNAKYFKGIDGVKILRQMRYEDS